MALSDTSKTLISIKKLVGKAHTSNDKDVANEALPSGLTVSSNTVFGEAIPTTANQTNDALFAILTGSGITGNGQVEYLRLQASFIAGSDTSSGRHGFELKLPSDYETNSKNPLAGTYPYKNNQSINITSGSLQLIPPSYATSYEAKAFSGGNTTKDNGTQIPVLDARDWFLDYFNGIFFQQDPPGTGDDANNPDHVQAYLYIGKYLNEVVSSAGTSGGSGDAAAAYVVISATGSLSHERVLTQGAGVSITDAGANGNVTIANANGNYVFNEYLGQANGANTLFSLDNAPTANKNVSVFVNGQLQMPATAITSAPFQDYSITGSNIFFTTASIPPEGSLLLANYTTNASI